MASENTGNIQFSPKHYQLLALAEAETIRGQADTSLNGGGIPGLRVPPLMAAGMFDAPELVSHLVVHGLLENQVNPSSNTESNVYAVTPKGRMVMDRAERKLAAEIAKANAQAPAALVAHVQAVQNKAPAHKKKKPAAKPAARPAARQDNLGPIPDVVSQAKATNKGPIPKKKTAAR